MSPLLTPEVIEAIAKNADAVRAAISSGDEMAALNSVGCHDHKVCCPKFLKFKFVLCDVEINNINAVAKKHILPHA